MRPELGHQHYQLVPVALQSSPGNIERILFDSQVDFCRPTLSVVDGEVMPNCIDNVELVSLPLDRIR